MIELLRYARVKPQGLASAKAENRSEVAVSFKRFDVENGKEVSPEICIVSFDELEKRLEELKQELVVVKELLELK